MIMFNKQKINCTLSIIIVNFNNKELLLECLSSIKSKVNDIIYEIIVVDNASTDGSPEVLQEDHQDIVLISNNENRGFSAANNQGAARAAGDYLLFLNNDTKIIDGSFDRMIRVFSNQNIGMIGLGLINKDGTPQVQGGLFGKKFWKSKSMLYVDFVIGAAMVIPKQLFTEIGGFDENYKFFNEDIDICKKIKQGNYRIVFYPDVKIIHYGGSMNRYLSEFSIIEGYTGGLYFFKKHYGKVLLPIYKILVITDLLSRIIITTIKKIYDQEPERILQMKEAYYKTIRLVIKYS
ncbi:MAG: hypothetical protein DKM50_04460 [Candidatus Margulisiibacteriota bacterium]|nr:MAG: hypothetical protein A2X43_05600 [Candidatus Margulisbacteria bacterium GWD2_39_127]OGI01029.1 MAG: hypothetical protein A2X42_12240 [Candidatus Margulisbacteria bacterium GWF2_38_17]OGI09558.1 MAG: hypothetical protein A2X41_06445 [Candidatus Margulisbacteria bacterium GWE2_39_32]PZM82003.1 MAG: hypothetical protein DKM50_04460 [Candidatus Margulisiibacteriota bacterium]HCY35876.1 hypothetical protein [Candidatus Margulisiibacteriota bacterium]